MIYVEENAFVKMEEEPGCIHYDTFQTDCRKGKGDNEDKDCTVNSGNEMQVRTEHSSRLIEMFTQSFDALRALPASSTFLLSLPGWTTQILPPTPLPLLTDQPLLLAMPGGAEPTGASVSPHLLLFGSFWWLFT